MSGIARSSRIGILLLEIELQVINDALKSRDIAIPETLPPSLSVIDLNLLNPKSRREALERAWQAVDPSQPFSPSSLKDLSPKKQRAELERAWEKK